MWETLRIRDLHVLIHVAIRHFGIYKGLVSIKSFKPGCLQFGMILRLEALCEVYFIHWNEPLQ